MWQDLRYSIRTLLKQPVFAAVAAAVLALGIGLNTAVFSVVAALLFRPLPVHAPEELVYIYWTLPKQPDRPAVLWHGPFDYLREHNQAFAGLSGTWARPVRFTADGETELLHGEQVQIGYFEVLGLAARLGRTLLPGDSDPAVTEPAIVISHDLWTRRFDSDPDVLGRQVRLAGESEDHFTIVGVAPPGFKGISDPWTPSHFWIPSAVIDHRGAAARQQPGFRTAFLGFARLEPGVDVAAARAIVEAQGLQYFPERPEGQPRLLLFPASDVRMPYWPLKAVIPTRLAAALTIVVLMVLLVAVANIAGILMARGVSRSPEVAVRRVLGAGGWRIARQLVTESLLLAGAGGVAGLLLAHWLLALFHAFTPLQYALDASIDWRAVLFSLAACVICGVLVGLAPAAQAIRLDILPALASAATTTTRKTRRHLRHGIVLPQVALSLVLLLVAGVYVRALMRLELTDPGYNASNVVVVNTALRSLPGERPGAMGAEAEPRAERVRRYYHQLLARVQALPGIDAAIASTLPLHSSPQVSWTVVPYDDYEAGVTGHPAMRSSVSPGYFQTMGMRVLQGRDFDARDTRATPRAGIIGASLAGRLWPGLDPIGRTAALVNTWPGSKPETFEVIGVVNDVQPVLHDAGWMPFVYLALGQQWQPDTTFVVARSSNPHAATQQVKSAVAGADPFADAFRPRTLGQMIAEILYPRRIAAAVLFASGCIALLLASVGIYGVMSYSVAERLGEIGVRRALGAEAHDIARLVLGEGLKVAALGSFAGLVLGYAAIRITSSRFLALPQIDLVTLIAVPLVLAAVVVLACAVPARRATRVDPMDVLRRN